MDLFLLPKTETFLKPSNKFVVTSRRTVTKKYVGPLNLLEKIPKRYFDDF